MKKQFSLATLLYTAITIQVCLALYVGLPESRLLATVIVCEVFCAIGAMWFHWGAMERDHKRRELAKKKGAYLCPYCGEVFQTHKAFPVCRNCSRTTRSRGPSVSIMLVAFVVIVTIAAVIADTIMIASLTDY